MIAARWEKHPTDPTTIGDADVVEYRAFAQKYMPNLNIEDNTAVPGYINSVMISRVLGACGDDTVAAWHARLRSRRDIGAGGHVFRPQFVDGAGQISKAGVAKVWPSASSSDRR